MARPLSPESFMSLHFELHNRVVANDSWGKGFFLACCLTKKPPHPACRPPSPPFQGEKGQLIAKQKSNGLECVNAIVKCPQW
jgi:hypothetical protein